MSLPSVQTLWIGPALKPLHTECLLSFLIQGHSVDLYCYEKVLGVPSGVNLRSAAEILPSDSIFAYQRGPGKGSFSAFSNIFRYALLLKKGGTWVDTDMFCLKPWTFSEPYTFASETIRTEKERILASCLISCPPRSSLMRYCLEEAYQLKSKALNWGEIGPQLLTRAVKKFRLDHYIRRSWEFCALGWDETELLTDPDSSWRPPQKALGIHLNHEMLRRHQQDTNSRILDRLRGWSG